MITAQVGEAQAVAQLLLLGAQLIEQKLHRNASVREMADGDGGDPLVIGAQWSAGSGWRVDPQGGQQRQSFGTTGAGSLLAAMGAAGAGAAVGAAETLGLENSAAPVKSAGSATEVTVERASTEALGAVKQTALPDVPAGRPK
jgi:hypothetical protein